MDGVELVIYSDSKPNLSTLNSYPKLYWPDVLGNSLSCDQILQVCNDIIKNINKIDVVIQILTADEEVGYCHELNKENKTDISWHSLSNLAKDTNTELRSNVFDVNIEGCYLIVTVDKNLSNSLNLLKCLQELQVTEEELHPDDEFPLERQLLDQLQIKESEEEKPFYYASQESAAYQLVKRIRFILAHHYGQPKGDEFSAFKDFDFQIFTARSNMLEIQTRMRLCHRQSGCFKPDVYDNPRKLGDLAKERVSKYVASKSGMEHLAKLMKKAENNRETLFLIVADEAHWGITISNSNNTIGINDKFINVWDDKTYRNVIVLLVSATPWNLLTSNSRIPETYIAMHKESGEIVAVNEEKLHHLLDQSGKDVTNDVGPKKELHVVQWTETFDDHLCKGLLMSLKTPQKLKKQPIWLQIDKTDRVDIGHKRYLYKWKGSTQDYGHNTLQYFLFEKTNRGVEVYSSCKKFILVGVNSPSPEIGFMTTQDFKEFHHKGLFCSFELLLNFGEDIIEIRSGHDRFLKFDTKSNCVTQARPPADEKTELGFLQHSPEYSFIVDFRKSPHEIIPAKQYLSLNFYFNSMRNSESNDQLIRHDKNFQELQKDCKIDFDCLLATEYAYCILLISDIRDFQINAKTLIEFIQNLEEYCSKYMNSRTRKLEHFCRELAKASACKDKLMRSVSLEMFKNMCGSLESMSLEHLKEYADTLPKPKNLTEIHSKELVRYLIKYVLHANHESFAKNIKEIMQSLSSGGDNRKLLTINRNLQKPFNQFFNEEKIKASETVSIINDLIVETPPISGIFGKMKVVRVSKSTRGNQFYATMVIARKVAEKEGFFEIIRYFDKFKLDDARKTQSVHRMWQVLQRKECQLHSQQSYQRCPCKNYKPIDDALTCDSCRHEHFQVNQFTDLDRLPCILILVDKGRLGDTFPPSFNTMDLRASHSTQSPVLATLMQELGRLCRYQPKANYSKLPYALVGFKVLETLQGKLKNSAAFTSSCNKVDIHAQRKRNPRNANLKPNGGMQTSMRPQIEASKSSYDFQNTTTFRNRLLLQAEPQIGKTGVFLKTIAILREQICCKSNIVQEDLMTDSEDSDSDSDDETIQNVVFKQDDWKFPFWKDMRDGKKLKTKIESSKYSAVYGPYKYNVTPEYVMYGAQKRKTSKAVPEYLAIENTDKYRAFSYQEHNRAGQCRECRVSSGYTIKQAMVAGREIKISVPQLKRFEPLLDKLQSHIIENSQADFERGDMVQSSDCSLSLDTWIFNPSYGRSEDATINYSHCISGKKCHYVQILVVRSEDFDAYHALWQSTHALVELPPDFDGCDVDASMGGIGFARLFIQRFAETLQLPKIFVIDDNIYRLHQIIADASPSGERIQKIDPQGRKLIKEIPFFEMLKHMESQFVCAYAPKEKFHPCETQQYNCECSPSKTAHDLHRFTGPSEIYGVLGVLRLRPNARRVKHPFKKTHVCSLVLLNIEALKQNGIRYKPWQVHEDLNLNNDCDTKSLIVCKYNQYLMSKKQMKTWIPEVYEWPDNAVLLSDPKLKEATGDAECMLRWIRLTAAPKCLNLVLVDGSGGTKMIAHDEYSEVLRTWTPLRTVLMGLLNVKLGRYHTVAFACDHPVSSVSVSSIQQYFCQTAGIGGFTRHVLILPIDLCQKLSLVDLNSFQTRLICPVFSDDVNTKLKMKLFSSHNIQHYQINFVVVLVLGKITNPLDREEQRNLDVNAVNFQKRPAKDVENTTKEKKRLRLSDEAVYDDLEDQSDGVLEPTQAKDNRNSQDLFTPLSSRDLTNMDQDVTPRLLEDEEEALESWNLNEEATGDSYLPKMLDSVDMKAVAPVSSMEVENDADSDLPQVLPDFVPPNLSDSDSNSELSQSLLTGVPLHSAGLQDRIAAAVIEQRQAENSHTTEDYDWHYEVSDEDLMRAWDKYERDNQSAVKKPSADDVISLSSTGDDVASISRPASRLSNDVIMIDDDSEFKSESTQAFGITSDQQEPKGYMPSQEESHFGVQSEDRLWQTSESDFSQAALSGSSASSITQSSTTQEIPASDIDVTDLEVYNNRSKKVKTFKPGSKLYQTDSIRLRNSKSEEWLNKQQMTSLTRKGS